MAASPAPAYGTQTNQGKAVFMTPKDHPLDGGVFVSRNDSNAPPLPAKKQTSDDSVPGGRVLDAQKHREQEISDKKKALAFDEEKQELQRQGLINKDEVYTIDNPNELHRIVEDRKRWMSGNYDQGGYSRAGAAGNLSDEQLKQLVKSGVLTEQDLINNGVMNKTNALSNSRDPMMRQVRCYVVNLSFIIYNHGTTFHGFLFIKKHTISLWVMLNTFARKCSDIYPYFPCVDLQNLNLYTIVWFTRDYSHIITCSTPMEHIGYV